MPETVHHTLSALSELLGKHKPKTDKAREKVPHRKAPHPSNPGKVSDDRLLSAAQVFEALSEIRPANAIPVEETPSNLGAIKKAATEA
jgi:benzoylformate decarboxylase